MSDEPLEQFERQIASMRVVASPMELRGAVLCHVERELRARGGIGGLRERRRCSL